MYKFKFSLLYKIPYNQTKEDILKNLSFISNSNISFIENSYFKITLIENGNSLLEAIKNSKEKISPYISRAFYINFEHLNFEC